MQIRTLTDIVEGQLLNTPSISFITQINTDPMKIHDGDLFLSNNLDDIKLAIENGAFAIIFDVDNIDYDSIDNEIAWIKVIDLDNALLRLTRFLLSPKEIKSYYCDIVSFDILKLVLANKKSIQFLSGNIMHDINNLKDIENDTILVSSSRLFMNAIQPLSKHIEYQEYKVDNLIIKSMFTTTFSYDGEYYNSLRIPYLYINHLISVVNFINSIDILEYELSNIRKLKHFRPIFIDNDYNIVEFGKSNRFVIASEYQNISNIEISFINKMYGFAKISIISEFKDDISLYNHIKICDFNCLYIVGKSRDELESILIDKKEEQLKLF